MNLNLVVSAFTVNFSPSENSEKERKCRYILYKMIYSEPKYFCLHSSNFKLGPLSRGLCVTIMGCEQLMVLLAV